MPAHLTLLILALAVAPVSGLAEGPAAPAAPAARVAPARAAPARAAPATPPVPAAQIPWAVRRDLNRAQAQLRQQLSRLPRDEGIEVLRASDSVTLRVPAHVLFAPDSESLRHDRLAARVLSVPERLLRVRRRLGAQIEVYTDNIGGRGLNQVISQQRAAALLSALRRAGIAARRLQAQGAGLSAAIASNDTPEGRMRNRRVEFVFERAGTPAAPAAPAAPALKPVGAAGAGTPAVRSNSAAAAPLRPEPAAARAGA
ncbi:MAG TPA: OmpA family protein [Steroidobacteraceae bacterium]|nr:OmpA family protein [Steroidobacteraceae bacterium]